MTRRGDSRAENIMKAQIAIQRTLSRKLADARSSNPAYSLRAFSRKLGMSSSAVSEIVNGKRTISRKLAQRIVTRLSLDPVEADRILNLFPSKGSKKNSAAGAEHDPRRSLQLSADEFRTISDWYHFAILSLLETEGSQSDAGWIARRLGIPVRDAAQALSRLERLGMLVRHGDELALTGKSFSTTDEVNNLALRKSHAQNLELARQSLETDALELRDFTAMTMAIDIEKLPEAKKLIRSFRDRLSEFLEQDVKKEVYKLCIQLIPLSRGGNCQENLS